MNDHGFDADLIVVGLGAMGSAVVLQAVERGLSVIGLDRYDPPHHFGSTKAETRITRLAVGEGSQYLPFVRRSHEIWRELEERTGEALLHECGGVIITEREAVEGQRWEDFVVETAAIAASADIDYEVIEPSEARTRHPFINVPDGLRVGFEPTAGLAMVERCVEVQLALARAAGAVVHTNTTVQAVGGLEDGIEVTTSAGTITAANAVVAAGPWMPELVGAEVAERLSVTRQVVYWFEVDEVAAFSTSAIPFVMWVGNTDEDYVGFFPIPPGGVPAVKLLSEQFVETTDPHSVDRTVGPAEIAAFYDRHVRPNFVGVTDRCVDAQVCLYTNTPDDHFLIDTDGRNDRIVVMSACSGHGFKHSAALGEAVAERIASGMSLGGGYDQGHSLHDLEPFRAR